MPFLLLGNVNSAVMFINNYLLSLHECPQVFRAVCHSSANRYVLLTVLCLLMSQCLVSVLLFSFVFISNVKFSPFPKIIHRFQSSFLPTFQHTRVFLQSISIFIRKVR